MGRFKERNKKMWGIQRLVIRLKQGVFLAIGCFFVASAMASNSQTEMELFPQFGAYQQGSIVALTLPADARLTVDGHSVLVSPEGRALFGIGRDATSVDLLLEVDGKRWRWQEAVPARRYDIQRIEGLPESKVNPDPKVQAEIQQNNAEVAQARKRESLSVVPDLPFEWPVAGRISGVYGSQRILNGTPKRPHFGVDIAAPEGTPILAPADGVVVLAHPNMVLTGQTLLLDHGAGLKSIYIHMSATNVRLGDKVQRGQQIGAVGKTGRATGPHLHWGVSWFGVQIDPISLTMGQMP
jgi:hypothetical protein